MSSAPYALDALNFLLKVGLFKSLKNEKGKVSFRAVTKEEITVCVCSLAEVQPKTDRRIGRRT